MLTAILCTLQISQAPQPDPLAYVRAHRAADAWLVAGRLDAARSGFERCLELSPRNPTVAYALACTYTRASRAKDALDWLDRSAEWGYFDAEVALWDSDLTAVRNEAR